MQLPLFPHRHETEPELIRPPPRQKEIRGASITTIFSAPAARAVPPHIHPPQGESAPSAEDRRDVLKRCPARKIGHVANWRAEALNVGWRHERALWQSDGASRKGAVARGLLRRQAAV